VKAAGQPCYITDDLSSFDMWLPEESVAAPNQSVWRLLASYWCMVILDGLVTRRLTCVHSVYCFHTLPPPASGSDQWQMFKSYVSARLPLRIACRVDMYHTTLLPHPKSFVCSHADGKLRSMANFAPTTELFHSIDSAGVN